MFVNHSGKESSPLGFFSSTKTRQQDGEIQKYVDSELKQVLPSKAGRIRMDGVQYRDSVILNG